MGTRLLEETDDYLLVEESLHNNQDSFDDWMMDGDNLKYPQELISAIEYALYEVTFVYRVDKETNKVTILFLDGRSI